jgi:hypothetical protein
MPSHPIQGHGETLRVEAGHAARPVLPSDCLRDNAHGSLIRFGIRNDYSPNAVAFTLATGRIVGHPETPQTAF